MLYNSTNAYRKQTRENEANVKQHNLYSLIFAYTLLSV